MSEIQEVSQLNINNNEFAIKDAESRTYIEAIITAIGSNNDSIGTRINDLNDRLETVEGTSYENVQPNWNESDTTADSYILNKPEIPDVGSITNNEIDSMWNRIVNGVISFTINNVSYQAGVNMTWAAWVESDYNTGGFSKDSSYIYGSNTYYHVEDVTPNMNIIADTSYVLTAAMDME